MKSTPRFLLILLTLSVTLLSACSAAPAVGDNSNVNGSAPTPVIVDDNANSSNSNDTNSNDANSNDTNTNDDNTNTNSNGQEIEIVGVVQALTDTTITINGLTYNIPAGFTQFTDMLVVGSQVSIRLVINADGTFTILQAEISIGDDNGNDANSNDDNGNDANSNDDNGNDANSNDDNGNDDNSNDDSGGDNDNGGSNDNG